ncbi:MAG: hypothetical protein M1813_009405 [Trichoglossum hirsutum]|nr:MAG: hypothetical protein M1813_009405 [Trichoglossum hirsutum]
MARRAPLNPAKPTEPSKPSKPSKSSKPSKPSKKQKGTISTSKMFKPTRGHKASHHTNSNVSAFKKAVSASRAHILTAHPVTLSQAHTAALNTLETTKSHYTALSTTLLAQKADVLAPLDGETYSIVPSTTKTKESDSSPPRKTVVLGPRIQAFKAMVEAKEAEVRRLWEEWSRVQEELSAVFVAAGKKMGDELVEEFKEVEGEVIRCVEDAIQMMRDSEDELDLHRRTQQKKFLALISDM